MPRLGCVFERPPPSKLLHVPGAFDYEDLAPGRCPSSTGSVGPGGHVNARLRPSDTFVRRHIGPRASELTEMLATVGLSSVEELVDRTVPSTIRAAGPLAL